MNSFVVFSTSTTFRAGLQTDNYINTQGTEKNRTEKKQQESGK